ncbi:drug/metabolite transporter (DMT)-like permease [Breznakibacter xylanolyticus]|uniref:Drug/metabolite transporter (DMT)-like permease n=1 Tax=Breznakibacter xylanolyticus TaxID=990 RepID=A0A2W7NZU7_9BACT|nr:DMT family transporter [Breznakibacter xylanolyticus]MBN2744588.1 DMT family transporter [Marinilabiliaceae bacterium]PZX16742.1 drug/metabolite transporter (DMT)-like permease [Breznakibacter xylanolyticus]
MKHSSMRTTPKVIIALALSMIFWSFSYVWVKIAYESFQPITTITLRLTMSTVMMGGILLAIGRLQPIAPEDRKWFLLLAFLEPFLYYLGESYGLKYVTSTQAAVIIATIPLFSPILAYLFYRERLSAINVLGIGISIGGVVMIVAEKNTATASTATGIILMFFAVTAALFYGVMLRRLANKYSPLTIITIQNGIGTLMFLPLFFTLEWQHFAQTIPSPQSIWALIWLAIFASSLAFILFAYGIQQIGLSRANVYTNTIPAITAIIARLMLNEPLSTIKIAGIIIVIAGLYVSQIKTAQHAI